MEGSSTSGRDLGPSALLAVIIGPGGPFIGGLDGATDVPLDLDALRLVENLSAARPVSLSEGIDGITGADRNRLLALADELLLRGLLVDRSPTDEVGGFGRTSEPPPVEHEVFDPTEVIQVVPGTVFVPGPEGFAWFDHDGAVGITVSAADLAVLGRLGLGDGLPPASLGPRLASLVGQMARLGLTQPPVEADRGATLAMEALEESVKQHIKVHELQEDARPGRRTRVVPIAQNGLSPPLALGLLIAYAKTYDGGRLDEHYHFRPQWISTLRTMGMVTTEPGIFLFSSYIWSEEHCLRVSAAVKEQCPASLTVHGGPSVPRRPGQVAAYFQAHPHVDVAVHGEGEETFVEMLDALVGSVGDGPPDLSPLHAVAGLSFRYEGEVVRTPDRDRIADLDRLPSPYLTGLFDAYRGVPLIHVVTESNRGCPYGCTFCDWGAATLSRIRKFDLDRVFEEIDWCGENQIESIRLADANFGIFARDVEIAERVATNKRTRGFPRGLVPNYAKNTVKHLIEIIEIMAEDGIVNAGGLSLQSMDEVTLEAIDRTNIKVEKYDQLAVEFRRHGLPLYVDLMVGLPGQTPASFKADLQECVDREVHARIPITEMLVNSPMNDPGYVALHKIETTRGNPSLVVSTSSFTRREYDEMLGLRGAFQVFESFGVLRHIGRYVRSETSMLEVDLFDAIRRDSLAEPQRWPALALAAQMLPSHLVAPGSWGRLAGEVRRYVVEQVGVPDDLALDTVCSVQQALWPSPGRSFPSTVELAHDYVAWYDQVFERKAQVGSGDWVGAVPPLRTFGPASFVVDSPIAAEAVVFGQSVDLQYLGMHWELSSPIARPTAADHAAMHVASSA